MYELLQELEALIEKWKNVPYTGDLTKAARSVCAKELREVIGQPSLQQWQRWVQDNSSNDAATQKGYCDVELLFQ